jgi:hypothetical protein
MSLAEVRHGAEEFCDFDIESLRKSSLCNRGVQKKRCSADLPS